MGPGALLGLDRNGIRQVSPHPIFSFVSLCFSDFGFFVHFLPSYSFYIPHCVLLHSDYPHATIGNANGGLNHADADLNNPYYRTYVHNMMNMEEMDLESSSSSSQPAAHINPSVAKSSKDEASDWDN